MDDLRRSLSPLTDAAWAQIDHDAAATLKATLAARRLVDFDGPRGWQTSAIGLGRVDGLEEAPREGVCAALRQVQPLVEFRVPFALKRSELDAVSRGAEDPDLNPLVAAARAIALAEDAAIFHGYAPAGITGIFQAAEERTLTIPERYQDYPAVVAQALAELRMGGVYGPYGIALGPRCFAGLTRSTLGGYPVIQHVQRLLEGGPVVWAPAINGAVVVSLRGGDFGLTVGRDFAIGYETHTADDVHLYIEESFTYRTLTPEAAVPLVYAP